MASRLPRPLILLTGILIVALGVRLALILASGVMIDGDEAVVGLQALHILRDGERPIFYYGQAYMGSLEAYLAAGVFALAGGPSRLALRVVPLGCALLLVGATYLLARRVWDTPTALMAALFAACPPLYVLVWTVKARGGFVETLLFGVVLLLLTSILMDEHVKHYSSRWGTWLAFGGLAGMAFWVNGMIAFYVLAIVPFVVWTVWRFPIWAARGLGVAALGALVGMAPLLVYNLRHGFATFSFLLGGSTTHSAAILRQAHAVFTYFVMACLPELTGAWQPHTASSGVAGALLLAIYGSAVLVVFLSAIRLHDMRLLLLSLVVLCVPLVFTLSGFGGASLNPYGFDATGRYTLPLATVLPLMLAGLVRMLWQRCGRGGKFVAVGLATIVLGSNLAGYAAADDNQIFQSEYWHRLPAHDAALLGCLDHWGIRDVWMNHWAGYPLMFDTSERIVAADYNDVVLHSGINRLPWTLEQVGAAMRPAFVLVTGTETTTPLESRLRMLGVTYRRCVALPYQVIQPLSRRVDPSEVSGTIGYQY